MSIPQQSGSVNTLERIQAQLADSDVKSSLNALTPFWGDMMPDWPSDAFFKEGLKDSEKSDPVLFISGPARNGNHLAHSMFDNHPQLARIGGEDGFLAALFCEFKKDPKNALHKLRSEENVDYILSLTGHGINKWKLTAEMNSGSNTARTASWSGVHGKDHYVSDYQDTVVTIDYAAFENRLRESADKLRSAASLAELFWIYLDALTLLDPVKRTGLVYPYVFPGSGMRAEMKYLLERKVPLRCVAPIRPFENFCFSFAKGRKKSDELDDSILREAWEHWFHKVTDYLILKRDYPENICLVNFVHLIESPEATARVVCRFLNIDYSETCLTPTSMGIPTKGNSSFPKGEEHRGTFYRTSLGNALDKERWPTDYPALWELVARMAV